MPGTKINLDAFLERNSDWNDTEVTQNNETPVEAMQRKSQEANNIQVENTELHMSDEKSVEPQVLHSVSSETESISINKEIEAWLEAVHEEIAEWASTQAQVAPEAEIPTKKHSLSLESLLGGSKKAESKPEAPEIKQTEKQNLEKSDTNNVEKIDAQTEEEQELFWNYESKFSSQSTKILERLRMPKTRVGMLASLTLISIVTIGWLMYTNPETHSISNYKASIKTIYNDIKRWEVSDESQLWSTNITWEIEDISNVDNTEVQDINEQEDTSNIPEAEPRKKEEIKKENLKNFLLENYK